jgi:penicillin-binding protein 2
MVVNGKAHGDDFKELYTKIAGKTGTAEEDSTRSAHALFVSYAPYQKPEISVTVVIPNGYASSNSMLVAREIYKYYFHDEEAKAKKRAEKEDSTKNSNEDDDDNDEAVIPTGNHIGDQ